MGGCRLLYFAKSTKFKNFAAVFLCQYIHSFIFPEMAERGGGATAPLNTPLISSPVACIDLLLWTRIWVSDRLASAKLSSVLMKRLYCL